MISTAVFKGRDAGFVIRIVSFLFKSNAKAKINMEL